MIFVETHAMVVLRMQFAVSKIINRYAHVNKATTEIQNFSVFVSAAEQMMTVQQLILASIDNVFQHVPQIHVATKQNALVSIMQQFANVLKVLMEIQRLDAMLSDAAKTMSAQ